MAKNTEKLSHLLSPTVTSLGYVFWGCEYLTQGRYSLLRVYIDSPNGITVDDCEKVSRQLSAVLDVEDPIQGHYSLEVSSPGLDRRLFTLEQYRQFIGQEATIKLHTPLERRRNFSGLLKDVVDEQVVIEIEGITFFLPFDYIEKGNLIPKW
jgi:ribosome maturation factor RimP